MLPDSSLLSVHWKLPYTAALPYQDLPYTYSYTYSYTYVLFSAERPLLHRLHYTLCIHETKGYLLAGGGGGGVNLPAQPT